MEMKVRCRLEKRWVVQDIHNQGLQRLAMESSCGMMIFGQGRSISNVLIIPKWRDCQEPVTVAIFTVLMRSRYWHCDGTPVRLVWQAKWIERSDQPADDCRRASVCVDWIAATKGETFRHCFGLEKKRLNLGLKNPEHHIIKISAFYMVQQVCIQPFRCAYVCSKMGNMHDQTIIENNFTVTIIVIFVSA